MIEKRPEQPEERVLVLAPTAKDAATSRRLFDAAGISCCICASIEGVCQEAEHGAGMAVVTAESVLGDKKRLLAGWLKAQPPWSDFPLIVLTPAGADSTPVLQLLDEVGPMTLMKRPVQVLTLISTVRSALRDRQRQYVVRDLLAERQQAAEALRIERELYRVTLSSIGDGVIATDTEGAVTFLNRVAEQLTGWDVDAARSRPLDEVFCIVNEDTRQPVPNPAMKALEEGVIVGLANHTLLIARDGSERPLDDSAAPIRDKDDQVVGAVLVFRDITEKKSAEAAVRASEVRFRALVNATSDVMYRMSADWSELQPLDGRGLVASNATPIRNWMHKNLPGSAHARVREAIARAVAGKQMFELEHQVIRADGSLGWTFSRAVPILGASGNIVEWFGAASDVTARKAAEEALARDALLLANVHDAVVVTDLEGIVTYWNGGATRLFGWTAEEMLGRPYADRFPEPVRSWVAGEIRLRAEGIAWSGEYEDYRKDGSRVWIDSRVSRITDVAGKLVGILGLSHDISERKKAEGALKEADRKKDDFIALLAHELRNPLAPIRNGLQVMRLAGPDVNAVAQARAMMDRQLGHMVRLIDDLLDISRISRNKMELRRTRVLLAEVISTAVETSRPAIDAAGHELNVSLPHEPVYMDADLTRLAQVFSNLLTNSAKYTKRDGCIWLSATARQGTVVVSVRDTGIGIPTESLVDIFDMFSQVDRSIERSTGGLGIGLALVKGLVEMHRGTVTAESAGPGKGSTFTVALPALTAQSGVAIAQISDNGQSAGGPKRRILVVDDNRDSAESLAMMLRLMNNEVWTANDGIEALDQAEAIRPEIIFMDLGMPRLNGLDATRRLREREWGKVIKVIALTGWGQDSDKERSRNAGCDVHLVKPVNIDDLGRLLGEERRA